MELIKIIDKLDLKISELEGHSDTINQQQNNISFANNLALFSYLFTSDSKSNTVKDLGRITTIASLIYSFKESKNSKLIMIKLKNKIFELVDMINNLDLQIVSNEINPQIVKDFLGRLITISQYLDTLVLNDIKIVTGKGHLSHKNIDILTNLTIVNVFYAKEVLEKKLIIIDPSIPVFDAFKQYNLSIAQIDIAKIKKEGLLVRCLIWFLILLSFLLVKNQTASSILLLSSLLLWFINHISPLFFNTKKMKSIVKEYLFNLETACGRSTINYRFKH
jgi:hypothetical protein